MAQQNPMVAVTMAIGEAIKELGEVPSGHLYAQVMSILTLEQYQSVIAALQNGGCIKVQNHLITWIK